MAKTLIYELYPWAWPGGLKAMTKFLERIKALGVDYVWVAPLYVSPGFDHGYDIADYKNIDPRFGNFGDFSDFMLTAHRLGLKVLMDLPFTSTSTRHPWLKRHFDYYCWDLQRRYADWADLFCPSLEAWGWNEEHENYYLHLYHPQQAQLNWMQDGRGLNLELVSQFQDIILFWMKLFDVDGFRLDFPQGANLPWGEDYLDKSAMYRGHDAEKIISALFDPEFFLKNQVDRPFIICELFDEDDGEIVRRYVETTPVDLAMNVLLKDTKPAELQEQIDKHCAVPGYLMELESHDSPRFPSRTKLSREKILGLMFKGSANAVCLYQGQELGLKNPPRRVLTDVKMCELDAVTSLNYAAGASLEQLRPISRANARVPIPLDVYAEQEKNSASVLNATKRMIEAWKAQD